MGLDPEVFQVVGVFVAAAAFLTGLHSVRLQGHRDRSVERLDDVFDMTYGRPNEAGETIAYTREIETAAVSLVAKRPSDLVWANAGLAGLSTLVVILGALHAHWRLSWPPHPQFWYLSALLAAQALLIAVMFLEERLVRRQLKEKLQWLAVRQPWAIARMVDNEMKALAVIVERSLQAVTAKKTSTTERLVRAYVHRLGRVRPLFDGILEVFEDDFIASIQDVKELGTVAASLHEQNAWLEETTKWMLRFVRMIKPGGRIEPPPDRPPVPDHGV